MQDNLIVFPEHPQGDTAPLVTSALPVSLTQLVGREHEVTAIQTLLSRPDVRLLTLTGTAGVGKTRLALAVARELMHDFADGVHVVSLAPLSDPDLVIPTIAHRLGLMESGSQPVLELLKLSQRDKRRLLILDNFEHVIAAAPLLAELLETCPDLKLLVTSREVLRLRGEQQFIVPPLALPDPRHLPDAPRLTHIPAIHLFLQRAQAVRSDFQLTADNAAAIAQICLRLDGLPLAIELAAARIKLLPPQALLLRLDHRLHVLTEGARDLPERQQTLRNTLAWSYDLLTAQEQQLFRRLSVFVGGCTLEAIEAVSAGMTDEAESMLDAVASLIDKSLLHQSEQEEGEPRLTLLETVREFGLESLHESGEAEISHLAHALSYLALAEEAEPHLKGAQQVIWWKRLEREQENLRAALSWLIGQEEGELALHLSTALWWFWNIRGYWNEGRRWLEAALALPQAQAQTASRAKALFGVDTFAWRLGSPIARSLLEESMAIYRELGAKQDLAEVLSWLGYSWTLQSNLTSAHKPLEESLTLAREVGDPWLLAKTLRSLGYFMKDQGNLKSARHFLEESVTLYREIKDQRELSFSLRLLTEVVMLEGNLTQATALANESLTLARELEGGPDIMRTLYSLAAIQTFQGDMKQAVALLEESQTLARELGDTWQIGTIQLTLGRIALYQRDILRAESCVEESLTLFKEPGTKSNAAEALSLLGDIRLMQEDFMQARAVYKEGALLAEEAGNRFSIGRNLIGLARVAAAAGQLEQATYLFGAAEPQFNPKLGFHPDMDPFERSEYERIVEDIRMQLGEKAFSRAWTEGRNMTLEQALARLEPQMIPTTTPPPAKGAVPSDGLTQREMDVLRLLAQGLTSAQIAERLVIGLVTVNSHVRSIYSKLGVTSRSAATRYALEHHLL